MLCDQAGYALSGARGDTLALYETALRQLHCGTGNPMTAAGAAIAAAPDFAMAHLLRAYLRLSRICGIAPAEQSIAAARRTARTQREALHVAAAADWAAGRLTAAVQHLDHLLITCPRDSLALHMGHLLDFQRGDISSLNARVQCVLPAWSAAFPHHQVALRLLAFGLSEEGAVAQGGRAGSHREAVRPRGAGTLRDFITRHNWWHILLYHLDREEHVQVPCAIGECAEFQEDKLNQGDTGREPTAHALIYQSY